MTDKAGEKPNRFNRKKEAIKQISQPMKKAVKREVAEHHTFRAYPSEGVKIMDWIAELNEEKGGKGKEINLALLIRGLIEMKENIDNEALLEAIKQIT
ncbi:hypothetical protein KO527_05185 [Pseudoalteromonas sp. C2R02]|uniref:hypothetical protein n=1 Tax=Pseudoalteromonas sp. C2R02 TaxID=2841565 RepID=UPI001C0A2254|nr:hypothetical protein [Pseudoalteromonas sp. C2R02]MBU2968741.1 hypothetical protein [Pseudoalteromonas sp. C2R02]